MTVAGILSDDHRGLLDVIDSLRSQNFSQYVDLPEIIVCGDQSSGKSSVLDAISVMRFPTKDGLCTRFATELSLRRGPERAPQISIIPGEDRFGSEREKLEAWKSQSNIERDGLDAVIEEAKQQMASPVAKRFYSDILRIELTGPEQPHLTMVDLPGLFKAGNSEQSDADGELVGEMVERYMARPRSIILAVVSAKNGYVLQEVTKMAQAADKEGRRTIGLITKPDTLDVGSDSEAAYIKLANNDDVKLRLGWHVLRNRNFEERDSTSAQRDSVEVDFFSRGIWAELNPSSCGVNALRDRLSSVLKDQIIHQLPSLVQDVEAGIHECTEALARLGPVRSTAAQQRIYLSQISDKYTTLITQAVDGVYTHDFFGSQKRREMYPRRLRAVVQNRLEQFAEAMHSSGKKQFIVEDNNMPENLDANESPVVLRSEYLKEVTQMLKYNKGRELPGQYNPLIVADLFLEQCRPWRQIVAKLVEDIMVSIRQNVQFLVDHIAPKDVADEILEFVNEGIEALRLDLDRKIEDLLPSTTSHPISYNDDLTKSVRKIQRDRYKCALQKMMQHTFGNKLQNVEVKTSCNPVHLMESLILQFETDTEDSASSDAADIMEAYYKVAVVRFIDNVSVLGIEACLLEKLPTLLRPIDVLSMEDVELSRLASESPKSSLEREYLAQKRDTLEKGLPILRGFQSRGRSVFATLSAGLTDDQSSDISGNETDRDSALEDDGVSVKSSRTQESESSYVPDKPRQSRPYAMDVQLTDGEMMRNGFEN